MRLFTSRRSIFTITNLKFQSEFVALAILIAISSCAIIAIGAWFIVQNINTVAAEIGQSGGLKYEEALVAQTRQTWKLLLIACVVNLVIVALMALAFSHRVTGVLRRLTRELDALADGEPTNQITPRERDFFPELIRAANRLL